MKVLVATKETQGQRNNDFCFADENEVVYFGFVCDKDKDDPDGECGCSRSLFGHRSRKATTTFKVVETSMTQSDLVDVLTRSLERAGYTDEGVREMATALVECANEHPEGTVLERRGDFIQARA